MTSMAMSKRWFILGTLGLAAFGWGGGAAGSRSTVVVAKTQAPPKDAQYYGVTYCTTCHTELRPPFEDDLCRLNEYKVWSEQDKHSLAYKILIAKEGTRAATMAKNMKWAKPFTEDARCLNCHAANVAEERRAKVFNIADGVSCDSCHGPSSLWVLEHAFKERWRTKKSAAEKEAMGMFDVRDPVKRATMCMGCHVGDATPFENTGVGRVVTHEMYAAGHPPLPGFEVTAFSEQLPKHWRNNKDKTAQVREQLKIDPNDSEFELAKLSLLGSVVGLKQTARMLESQTKSAAAAWPELAQFDCSACHHDLKSPSWRQQRGFPGIPGRPEMHAWPSTLLDVAITATLGDAKSKDALSQYHTKLDKLHHAFDAQPFGKPADIGAAATDLETCLNQLLSQMKTAKFTQPALKKLLQDLCGLGKKLPDYDSARQIAWTIKSVYSEANPKPANAAAIEDLFKKLDADLRTTLPAGTKQNIVENLHTALEKAGSYDGEAFRKRMDELSHLLGG